MSDLIVGVCGFIVIFIIAIFYVGEDLEKGKMKTSEKFELYMNGFNEGFGKKDIPMIYYLNGGWMEHENYPDLYNQGIIDGKDYKNLLIKIGKI